MKMFHNKLIVVALLLTASSLIRANGDIPIGEKIDSAPVGAKDTAPIDSTTTEGVSTTTTTTAAPIPTVTITAGPPATSTAKPPTTPSTTSTSSTTSTTSTSSTTSSSSSTSTSTTSTTAAPTTFSSTTSVPVTTTTAAPVTPTPKPTPYPQPSVGQWNSSCVLVKMAAQLNITYATKDKKNATALYNIPVDATVNDYDCVNNTQFISITWGPADAVNNMHMQFDLNKTSYVSMLKFSIPIVGERFPNAQDDQTVQLLHRGTEFKAPVGMSYHCTRSQRFNLTETVVQKQVIGYVDMKDVQMEAFRNPSNSTVFSAVHDCDSSETPDVVPIAVGIALAAMIMIILTAYLCARRRSNSRGYTSF